MWRQIRILVKVGMEMKGQQYLLQRTFGPQPINTNINPLDLFWQQLQTTYLRCLFSKTSLATSRTSNWQGLWLLKTNQHVLSVCSFYHRSCKMLVVTLWCEFLNERSYHLQISALELRSIGELFFFCRRLLIALHEAYITITVVSY